MKPETSDPHFLPVMESFHTIQGEGFHTGKSAYFIRLGGCDVGCHWCDVKESWDASQLGWVSVEELALEAERSNAEIVVITGGEPLMYDLSELTNEIHSMGMKTNIETSGAYPLTGKWDWVCFSPKKFKEPKEEFYAKSDELKVIVFNKSDFKWAQEHSNKIGERSKLYLQREWSKSKEVTPLIVEFVKQKPKWQISLQTHKYLDIP
ncbi:MAG: 7-carboxy-7-deazaguanine synthase QueE [Cyclobacteriaceae bacterium]